MKLLDVNLLIYAVDEDAAWHERARRWVQEAFRGPEPVVLPWLVLVAFVRLVTSPKIFSRPLTTPAALDIVDGWLALPTVSIVHPTDRHTAVVRELLADVPQAGNLTNDAHLAALAIEHSAVLCSSDADFGRFRGVRWSDPLRA